MQVRLLRVLQDRQIVPSAGTQAITVDVRVVAATNRDLERSVAEGKFREDLYYRLNVIRIETPSLRSRPEDIPLLLVHLLPRPAPSVTARRRGASRRDGSVRSHDTAFRQHPRVSERSSTLRSRSAKATR
jgi:transcriptional regulator with PAS, ATPase and Fis domain